VFFGVFWCFLAFGVFWCFFGVFLVFFGVFLLENNFLMVFGKTFFNKLFYFGKTFFKSLLEKLLLEKMIFG